MAAHFSVFNQRAFNEILGKVYDSNDEGKELPTFSPTGDFLPNDAFNFLPLVSSFQEISLENYQDHAFLLSNQPMPGSKKLWHEWEGVHFPNSRLILVGSSSFLEGNKWAILILPNAPSTPGDLLPHIYKYIWF